MFGKYSVLFFKTFQPNCFRLWPKMAGFTSSKQKKITQSGKSGSVRPIKQGFLFSWPNRDLPFWGKTPLETNTLPSFATKKQKTKQKNKTKNKTKQKTKKNKTKTKTKKQKQIKKKWAYRTQGLSHTIDKTDKIKIGKFSMWVGPDEIYYKEN